MKKLILSVLAFSAVAASAATAKLGSTILHEGDDKAVVDTRAVAGLKELTLTFKGEAVSLGEVVVVYRTGNGNGPYEADKFRINRNIQDGGSLTLDLPAGAKAVRRVELEAEGLGFNGDVLIQAYGTK
jgi:hypothetical protein